MMKNKYMRHRAGICKCLAVGLTAAMCMAMLAGCSTGQSTGSTSDTEVTSDVSTETDADKESPNGSADAENTSVKTEMTVEEMQAAIDEAMSDAAIDITDMFTKRDLAGTYDESEAVKITLSGKTAACDSSNVHIEDGVVTIKAAGVYVLSGTLTDGTVVVDAGDDDKVQLVFDGVSITAADYAAIYAKNVDKVFVTLTEGTENTLTVSGDYVQTDDNNVDAVIFAKCDLTLGGSGSLTVKDTTGHGIVSKDDLVVTSGTYTIDSQDHCLNGKDSVRIADGTFTLTCDEDGIHAGNDDQQEQNEKVEEMIDAGCDVLCINLVDRTAPSRIIRMARNEDIPVIFFNREPVREDLVQWEKLYYVGCDAEQSGIMQGEIAAEYINSHSEVDKNKDGKIQYLSLIHISEPTRP